MRFRLLTLALMFLFLASCAAATSIEDVTVSDDPVKSGSPFYVTVDLSGDTCNSKVAFYLNDEKMQEKNVVGCSKEVIWEYDDQDWDARELQCGQYNVTVVLTGSGGVSIENQSTVLNIGNMPNITITPDQPIVNNDVTITVTDRETGDPLKDFKIEVYIVNEVRTVKLTTNNQGKAKYKPRSYGRYEIRVEKRSYCGVASFTAKRKLTVDGPHPDNPVVGELITIAVPSSVGVKVLYENGSMYLGATTTIGGGANFTINKSGTYVVSIGELNSRYWAINKTLTVYDRPTFDVDLTPTEPVVGKSITITVSSRNESVEDARVVLSKPDGMSKVFTTPNTGKIVYTGVDSVGDYTLSVEKDKHSSRTIYFNALNKINLVLSPENPTTVDNVTVLLYDQNGKGVGGATVRIQPLDYVRTTNQLGEALFESISVGEYFVTASKPEYWNATVNLSVLGSLNVEFDSTKAELDNDVVFSIYDEYGEPASAAIRIETPSEGVESIEASSYSFTASEVGKYFVAIAKEGYLTSENTVDVTPHPIDVQLQASRNKIVAELTSHGQPLESMSVDYALPDGSTKSGTTDASGMSSIEVTESGVYNITVNSGLNPLYETKTLSQQVVKKYNTLLLVTVVLVILLAAAALIAVIGFLKIRKRKSKPPGQKPPAVGRYGATDRSGTRLGSR